jgi:chemotaxis protein MotA
MDMSTIGGLLVASALVLLGILLGSSLIIFIDLPSVVLVIGCTTACLFIGFPASAVIGGLKAAKNAFFTRSFDATGAVELLATLSNRARRDGLLSLEEAAETTEDPFLQRGLRMMADGHEPAAIESVLYDEIAKIGERHKACISVFDGIGAYAPAMGMVGTLIGLVQMLQQMDDPTKIGPAMAVALLTTFYGAVLANFVGIPLANKLKARSIEELAYKELIASGLMSILGGENPRFMVERLNATLPPSLRLEEAA